MLVNGGIRPTNGLPVPLGINVMKTDLGMDTIVKFDKYLQASIEFGLDISMML